MKGNTIYNVADPVNPQDVVTKEYADNRSKHLIVVHAKYCGPLKGGEYPFKFGGNSLEICEETIKKDKRFKGLISGFVMPHPGRIKKIICEGVTYIDLDKMVNELINTLNEDRINKLKKHFGKEDFKRDLLEKINTVDFTTGKNHGGKTFFEIVKFEKTFTPDRWFFYLLPKPEIVEIAIIGKFNWIEVELKNLREIREIRAIMKILKIVEHDNTPTELKEGDTINIQVSDFEQDLFSEGDVLERILQTAVLRLFGSLNFNFTFLIELDPL